jgi:hypothetical protein
MTLAESVLGYKLPSRSADAGGLAAAGAGPPASLPTRTTWDVGAAFQCSATDLNQVMICPTSVGCRPSGARRLRTRWILSALFSHDPPTGVYSGMIPRSNSQLTSSGVLCPARLSSVLSCKFAQ